MLQDEARLWRETVVQRAIGREAITPTPKLPRLEGGMFLADRGAAWMPLIGSEGLGSGLQGFGVMVRGAFQGEHWFAEGTFVGYRPMGQVEETRGRLQSFEVG